ncbi:hypothetical protein RN629_01610 [Sphingomonadaceae bacterium jetA1]|jgi:hypothetical protein|uniref:hypothetical protein n=1 Tax=Facivitalis istanbulensis TaxID=3075838 RepID=UPI00348BDE71
MMRISRCLDQATGAHGGGRPLLWAIPTHHHRGIRIFAWSGATKRFLQAFDRIHFYLRIHPSETFALCRVFNPQNLLFRKRRHEQDIAASLRVDPLGGGGRGVRHLPLRAGVRSPKEQRK